MLLSNFQFCQNYCLGGMKIDVVFLVSHFQKIGEGIFHYSLILNIGQAWWFSWHKAVFLVYSINKVKRSAMVARGARDEIEVETCKPRSDVPTIFWSEKKNRKNVFEPKICDQIFVF